jgi:uncharacterized protein YbjT (DUF2867 family)
MRVLVVGATGLIGGTIVARLIEAGCEVVGIARRTAAAARSIPAVGRRIILRYKRLEAAWFEAIPAA